MQILCQNNNIGDHPIGHIDKHESYLIHQKQINCRYAIFSSKYAIKNSLFESTYLEFC